MAAISKAARERKRLEREGIVREPEGERLNYNYIALVGLVVAAVGVYYTYRTYHDNRPEADQRRWRKSLQSQISMLDTLD